MGSGLIPDRIANRLIKENQSHDINRTGRIWFIFTTSLLKDEFGVRDLFRFWGGEALYNLHDRDPEIGPILASIGEPTIVEACVPIVDMGPSAFPGEPLVQNYLLAHGIATRDFNFTLRAERPVPGSPNSPDHIIEGRCIRVAYRLRDVENASVTIRPKVSADLRRVIVREIVRQNHAMTKRQQYQ
jgi:hypothetical protein